MEKIVNKTVNWDPVGTNGNAFAVMGGFSQHARRQGWTKEEIDAVLNEARSGNYDHLLATIINHCDFGEPEIGTGELQDDSDDDINIDYYGS